MNFLEILKVAAIASAGLVLFAMMLPLLVEVLLLAFAIGMMPVVVIESFMTAIRKRIECELAMCDCGDHPEPHIHIRGIGKQ